MKIIATAVLTVVLCAFATMGLAQEQSQSPSSSDARIGDLIDVLKDDARRQQLIGQLEQLRNENSGTGQTPAETSKSAEGSAAAGEEDAVFSGGLVTGLSQWFSDLAQRLPTAALGAPIDVKFNQAEVQVQRRLAAPGAVDDLKGFGSRSLVGWAVITVAALAVFLLARRRIRTRVARGTLKRSVVRDVAVRSLYALLPLVVCIVVALIWVAFLPYSDTGKAIFVLLAMPFAGAVASASLMSALLVLLAPSKGWRLVSYAQRRLSPLVGTLIGLASAGSAAIAPDIRSAIGPSTSDIISLVFDIAVPVFAAVIIALHRRTVRSLIVRGYSKDSERPVFDRAIYWIGTHWQHFGFLFVILNIGARLFGAQSGSFLTQSSLSVAVIVVAFIAVASIRRFENKRIVTANRRPQIGVRPVILRRLSSIAYRTIQVIIIFYAAVFCLGLWGLDVGGWVSSPAGLSVIGPILSIALMMLVAWSLWVGLDAWITAALSQSQVGGTYRERSARVRTLLPLLRNVAFVVLTVLTVIGVLANLGVNVAPLIAGAGVVGLAVGFGSQQLVQDVITGLFILLEDTLAIGDVIDTGDRAGTVEALTIRTVKIRDGDGALHTIPFSTVKALKNSSRGFGVYTVAITLAQGADIGKALDVFKDVGEEVRSDPKFATNIVAPLDVWGVDQVGLDGIVIKGAIKTRPLQQYGVGREINRRMNGRLQELGIPLAKRSAGWSGEKVMA